MGAYTVKIIDKNEHDLLIKTIRQGFFYNGRQYRPNNAIATALLLESNLGIRIIDILHLTLNSFVKDGDNYRLDIVEKKTSKICIHKVPEQVYNFVQEYCNHNNITASARIVPICERQVQKHLKACREYLGIEKVSTHSFRKMSGSEIYESSGHDIEAVREFYNHSSVNTTQAYIKRNSARLEQYICDNVHLV